MRVHAPLSGACQTGNRRSRGRPRALPFHRGRSGRRRFAGGRAARGRRGDRRHGSRGRRDAPPLRWSVRPAIMPNPTAAWAFASLITPRSRRADIWPITAAGCLIVDFDYHHGNGTEAIAGDGFRTSRPTRRPPIPEPDGRATPAGDDVTQPSAYRPRASPRRPSWLSGSACCRRSPGNCRQTCWWSAPASTTSKATRSATWAWASRQPPGWRRSSAARPPIIAAAGPPTSWKAAMTSRR